MHKDTGFTATTSEVFLALTVATLPAFALLVVVHRTILTALFTIRFVRCKGDRADCHHQDRKQDLRVIFHKLIFGRD